jgi:hypothetical protein
MNKKLFLSITLLLSLNLSASDGRFNQNTRKSIIDEEDMKKLEELLSNEENRLILEKRLVTLARDSLLDIYNEHLKNNRILHLNLTELDQFQILPTEWKNNFLKQLESDKSDLKRISENSNDSEDEWSEDSDSEDSDDSTFQNPIKQLSNENNSPQALDDWFTREDSDSEDSDDSTFQNPIEQLSNENNSPQALDDWFTAADDELN